MVEHLGQSQASAAVRPAGSRDRGKNGKRTRLGWLRANIFFVLAVLSALVALAYQTVGPVVKPTSRLCLEESLEWASQDTTLEVYCPRRLLHDPTAVPQPMYVYLRQKSPLAQPSAAAVHASGRWSVSLSPAGPSVLFTDRDGSPAPALLAVAPGSDSPLPAVIFVRRAPLAEADSAVQVQVIASGPDGTQAVTAGGQPMLLTLLLEGKAGALWRRLLEVLLGPATPTVALAAGLLVYYLEQQRFEEEKRREALSEIEALYGLRAGPAALVARCWELQERIGREVGWKHSEARQALDKALAALLTSEQLLLAAAHWFGVADDTKARRAVAQTLERCGDQQGAKSLEAVLKLAKVLDNEVPGRLSYEEEQAHVAAVQHVETLCAEGGRGRASDLLRKLWLAQGRSESEITKEDRERMRQNLSWLRLWPDKAPPESDEFSAWLTLAGKLEYNPFGREVAELDTNLREYCLSTMFEAAEGCRHAAVFGSRGSGKTAAALFIADSCERPVLPPREYGAFPVYWSPPYHALAALSQPVFMFGAVQVAALAVGNFLTRRPDSFFRLDEGQRHATTRLLSYCTGSPEGLRAELEHMGPLSLEKRDLVDHLVQGWHRVPSQQDVGAWVSLLSGALPAGFDRVYLILDPQGKWVDRDASKEVSARLQPLLDLSDALASRQIFLKLFLPDALLAELTSVQTRGFAQITLRWNQATLTEMLEQRLKRASKGISSSLFYLCDPRSVSDGPKLNDRLVQAAYGSPRRLVRLGNQLLQGHVRRAPEEPLLSAEDVDSVLGPAVPAARRRNATTGATP